jgi:hypothetical protein
MSSETDMRGVMLDEFISFQRKGDGSEIDVYERTSVMNDSIRSPNSSSVGAEVKASRSKVVKKRTRTNERRTLRSASVEPKSGKEGGSSVPA